MILKGFKEKSNKNYINSELKNRILVDSNSKIKNVIILFNANEIRSKPDFTSIIKVLNLEEDKIKILAYKPKIKPKDSLFYPTFSAKNLGWNGKVKDATLKHLLDIEYDLLISYYKEEYTALKLITLASKAKFKIGIMETDERVNDLIIKTEIFNIKKFTEELKKYLTILNKI